MAAGKPARNADLKDVPANSISSRALGWIIHDFAGEKRKGALKD